MVLCMEAVGEEPIEVELALAPTIYTDAIRVEFRSAEVVRLHVLTDYWTASGHHEMHRQAALVFTIAGFQRAAREFERIARMLSSLQTGGAPSTH